MKYRFLFLTTLLFVVSGCAGLGFPLSTHEAYAQSLTPEQKARLEKELAQVEADQKRAEKDLADAKLQSSSITRDIAVLSAKIKVAQLNIKAKNLLIENLGKDIRGKEKHIDSLDDRIERGRDALAVIMRKTNETASYTLPEVLLSQASITGVFRDLDSFASVQESMKTTFEQIRSDKTETEAEKSTLEKRRNAETDARYVIQQEEKNIKTDEVEKKRLLTISKGNEVAYQAELAQKRQRATEIRAALFPLRGAEPIPFGTAYAYAVEAEQKTGVRAAFLLGIFAQESSLDDDATFGKQIGSCYMTDPVTGDGRGANTGSIQSRVMHPTRDIPPFLNIVQALGGEPSTTRVSCWQPVYDRVTREPIGWGGAMGPAQFIPSTWVLYVDRLKAALGISSMPNPWNPEHAFMAASMLLKDNGAAGRTYTAERNAACKYFSGRACPASGWILTYGTSAMANAEKIQRTMINPLQGL